MCSFSTVSCVQWTPAGSAPIDLETGILAGFEPYFKNSPKHLSDFYIGLSGNYRFKTIAGLNQQAKAAGMDQHVAEFRIELKNSLRDRVNGINSLGLPINEYELMKPTTVLTERIMVAWGKAILDNNRLDRHLKVKLLMEATTGDVNKFLPISSDLFSRAVEHMHHEFQHANAIIFPAIPIDVSNWSGKPVRLIAFKKETIIKAKSARFSYLMVK